MTSREISIAQDMNLSSVQRWLREKKEEGGLREALVYEHRRTWRVYWLEE